MSLRAVCCASVLASIACGSPSSAVAPDAGDGVDASLPLPEASPPDASPPEASVDAAPPGRMTKHNGKVLPAMRLVAVYFGEEGKDGAPSFDPFMTWLVASDYWGHMKQYGVGAGSFVGSVRLPASAVFEPGTDPTPLVRPFVFADRVDHILHPAGTSDAGASDAAAPLIPEGDAYIFFLPDGVNIDLLDLGGKGWVTCHEISGYHDFNTKEPYAVVAPCAVGRNAETLSHELTEMATDDVNREGWYSDTDLDNGGEIADLCNFPVTVEGWAVTSLWSNADRRCVPSQ